MAEIVSAENLATFLKDFEKAAEKHKQAVKESSRARSEENSTGNYMRECRKRYEEAYNNFWKNNDADGWREKNNPRTGTQVAG